MGKRSGEMNRFFLRIALLLGTSYAALGQPKATTHVTFFSSSVCYGTGAEKNHGYAWQFFHSGAIDTTRFQ
jgi:hypothetical protein